MFREDAKTSEVAWVKLSGSDEGDYIYVQRSWSDTDCWDYTFYDSNYEEVDGGQYDLPGIDNAFDVLFEIVEDIDESDVKFLDPEEADDVIF